MVRLLASFVTLALVASGALAEDSARVAGRFADLAQKSDPERMAVLFHYPPSYSETKRQKDTEAVADSLKWLLSNIGAPQNVKRRKAPAEFYEIGVYGGDNAYWESVSPIDEVQFLYDATFRDFGDGYLKVLVLRPVSGASPEIHMAGFGIPSSTLGARGRAITLILGLMEHSGTPPPPGMRELLNKRLQPSRATPGG